jgi:hypothetical protein
MAMARHSERLKALTSMGMISLGEKGLTFMPLTIEAALTSSNSLMATGKK